VLLAIFLLGWHPHGVKCSGCLQQSIRQPHGMHECWSYGLLHPFPADLCMWIRY
jgi:hypothetical protein